MASLLCGRVLAVPSSPRPLDRPVSALNVSLRGMACHRSGSTSEVKIGCPPPGRCSHPRGLSVCCAAAKTAPAKKGFGADKAPAAAESCPCGSKQTYKGCCEPYHLGAQVPASAGDALRARFSAYCKKKEAYLLSTFHPDYHAFKFNTEPGGATTQLKGEVTYAAKNFKYSNFHVRKVEEAGADAAPSGLEEAFVTFSYQSQHRTQPSVNVAGTNLIEKTVERSRFVRERSANGAVAGASATPAEPWRFASYELIEWPVWLESARDAELTAKERQEQMQLAGQAAPGEAVAVAEVVA